MPCGGLMEFAERGELDSEALHAYLSDLFRPYEDQKVEAVVLGCTHYVFLKRAIGRFFPAVPLIDGNAGTVRQLGRRLAEKNLLAPADQTGEVTLLSSGGEEPVRLMERLLALPNEK